jgi:uncharacterized membrane protein
MISGHLLYCFILFYFLVYTDGDLRTFTLLFYVITISIKQEIKEHKTVKKMSCDRHQYKPRNKTRTFTLLFYVALFLGLYWWWSQNIYFTVICCFICCFILMVISGHLLYCFMLFYFLCYTDGDLRTISITQEIKQHKTVK